MTVINKVTFGGRTLIDLTGDTVTPNTVIKGYTAHSKSGEQITGTLEASIDGEILIIPEILFSVHESVETSEEETGDQNG